MTQPRTSEVIKKILLEEVILPRTDHPDAQPKDRFKLGVYTRYKAMEACEYCNTEQKAQRIVQVINTTTGRVANAGLDCIEGRFHITRPQIEALASGQLGLAARVASLVGYDFDDAADMLNAIETELQKLASRYAGARQALAQASALHAHTLNQHLQEHYDLLTFVHFLQDAHLRSERYKDRLMALEQDPLHGSSGASAALRAAISVAQDPQTLSVAVAGTLRDAGRQLLKGRLSAAGLKTRDVAPWEFQDRPSYLAALERHYRAAADKGETRKSSLQLSYDRVLGISQIQTWFPAVLAVDGGKNGTANQHLRGGLNVQALEQALGAAAGTVSIYISQAEFSGPVWDKSIGAPKTRRTALYRCTAVWSADPWLAVYGLWAKYLCSSGSSPGSSAFTWAVSQVRRAAGRPSSGWITDIRARFFSSRASPSAVMFLAGHRSRRCPVPASPARRRCPGQTWRRS